MILNFPHYVHLSTKCIFLKRHSTSKTHIVFVLSECMHFASLHLHCIVLFISVYSKDFTRNISTSHNHYILSVHLFVYAVQNNAVLIPKLANYYNNLAHDHIQPITNIQRKQKTMILKQFPCAFRQHQFYNSYQHHSAVPRFKKVLYFAYTTQGIPHFRRHTRNSHLDQNMMVFHNTRCSI